MIIEYSAIAAAVGVVWDFVGEPIKGAVGEASGKLFGPKLADAAQSLKRRLVGDLPRNHDLVRGLRQAYLNALQQVIDRYKAELAAVPAEDRDCIADDMAFADRLQAWLDERLKGWDGKDIDYHQVTADDVARVLDSTIHPSSIEGFGKLAEARASSEREALAELQTVWGKTVSLPHRFLARFQGRGEPGWYDLFALFVSEHLKTDERFRAIFLVTELVEVKEMLAGLDQRFDAVETAAERRHREVMAMLARERGVPLIALQAQLARLGEVDVPIEEIPARLESFVTEFLKVREELSRKTNAPDVAEAQARALTLLEAGDLDGARAVFVSNITRRRETRQQAALEEAELLAGKGYVDRLQIRYVDAAAAFEEAAELVSFDAQTAHRYLMSLMETLVAHGHEFGDNATLIRAIEVAQERALPLVPRARVPLDWAATQYSLGLALLTLGERETGPERLGEAIAAFRFALEEWTHERVPLDWGMTQSNLGSALSALGDRESAPTRLEEAVTAYRLALDVRTQEHAPLEWAETLNNLGNVLLKLAGREGGRSRLIEAIMTYRLALTERTRSRVPLDWATTQNNLGNALATLGERKRGTSQLEEAAEAYRSALQERTRERMPFEWAMVQSNLGNVLSTLGEREGGTERLEEAVTAFRLALEELRRKRAPLRWAMTQNNLGSALAKLGRREGRAARLEEAVTAYLLALQEQTRERVPLDWAMTQNNLGNALSALGEREIGKAQLEKAVTAYKLALEAATNEAAPALHHVVKDNLNRALSLLAKR